MTPVAIKAALPTARQDGGDADLLGLASSVVAHLRAGRPEHADVLYRQMCDMHADAWEMLVFPVLISIQRGQALDALQYINSLPAERCPELRALCLHHLGDPTWHGEATALADSPRPHVARAMRELLGQSPAP